MRIEKEEKLQDRIILSIKNVTNDDATILTLAGFYHAVEDDTPDIESWVKPNRAEILLNEKTKLICEPGYDSNYKELFVGVEKASKDALEYHNLVVVREKYHYDENNDVVSDSGKYEVLVYGNPENNDYTEIIVIGE